MRIVFMGTPEFAVPSLEALAQEHEVALVVTRPDAVRSRGKKLEPSPVKAKAQELGLAVLEAKRMTEEAIAEVRACAPDAIAVAAFGCILPDEVLSIAPYGSVNVHASLLPRWRGAAPIQRAILAGDERAGVSIMRIAHELDAGAYCRQASLPIGTMGDMELTAALAKLGAQELVAALADMEQGTAVWQEQDESLVTFAPKVTKQEMLLDPADSAQANLRSVQASRDAAAARLKAMGRGVRIMKAAPAQVELSSGAVLFRQGHAFFGCADGSFEVLEVKPDGKRAMEARAWVAGIHQDEASWERA